MGLTTRTNEAVGTDGVAIALEHRRTLTASLDELGPKERTLAVALFGLDGERKEVLTGENVDYHIYGNIEAYLDQSVRAGTPYHICIGNLARIGSFGHSKILDMRHNGEITAEEESQVRTSFLRALKQSETYLTTSISLRKFIDESRQIEDEYAILRAKRHLGIDLESATPA